MIINVSDTLGQLKDAIGQIGERHIKRSATIALTRTAKLVKEALVEEMPRAFDRPTPWTLNGLMMRPATFENMTAEVSIKDFAPKGTPAIKYLRPQIFSGGRNVKRFERALRAAGVLPNDMYAVPGRDVPLDQYGNVSAPYITKMLSQLRAFPEVGYRANETEKGRQRRLKSKKVRGGDWFVVKEQRGKLKPGIYQRFQFGSGKNNPFGSAIKVIFIFTSQPQYTQRYNFFEIGERVVRQEFANQFVIAWSDALNKWGR